MKTLTTAIIIFRLHRHGDYLMRRYMGVVDEIAGGNIDFAEQACPSLKYLRRRAKACARLINRLRA